MKILSYSEFVDEKIHYDPDCRSFYLLNDEDSYELIGFVEDISFSDLCKKYYAYYLVNNIEEQYG